MNTITVHELRDSDDLPVIDVREADEYAPGHVPGAVNLPMSAIGFRLDEVPDGPVAVVCHLGVRSAQVVDALRARGYEAIIVDGGTAEWAAAGYPLAQ